MVLMEKIIRNRKLDVEKARERFQLSKRETEVVRLICQGLGNKEISGAFKDACPLGVSGNRLHPGSNGVTGRARTL